MPWPHPKRLNTMTTGFTKQTLEQAASGNPAWLQALRTSAWNTYEQLPFPTRRDVDYQRFDIRKLKFERVSSQFADTPAVTTTLAGPEAPGVIFCDLPTAVVKHGEIGRAHV